MALADVVIHQQRLPISHHGVIEIYVIDHGSVRLQNIRPAVVVIVDELCCNAAQKHGFVTNAGAVSDVGKRAVAIIVIEAVELQIEMRDIHVEQPVTIHVGGVNAHACLIFSVFTCGDSGDERSIREFAVFVVQEQEIGPGVVGNDNVRPAVAVKVGKDNTHALGLRNAYAGFIAEIGKRTVVIIAVKLRLLPAIVIRIAIGAITGSFVPAPEIVLGRPIEIVRHDKVEPAIVIKVEPAGASRPVALVGYAGLRSYIGKGSIAVVVVENGSAIAGDIEVGVTVVVIVANGDALAVMVFAADAGFFRHIGKRPVAVVAIKRRVQWARWLVVIGGGGLNEVEIHQAVLVVVEPRDAGTHGFEIVLLFASGRVLNEGDSGLFVNVSEVDRGGSRPRGCRRRLSCGLSAARSKQRREGDNCR